ncbi:DgyrCDS9218 [Dimorphilus gyrociliatus]|uniref:DgyrCDS9218 n=1 Tax=Dimorphilus gyrociliatus TaxID=2664684 RepID=A0A7I8VWQ3_9ANNE|nr:DgyrCDS9218 [Dimorphilus gyrociliatus]
MDRNINKKVIYIFSMLNIVTQISGVQIYQAPSRVVAKLGETLNIRYGLSKINGIQLERLYSDVNQLIYKTPNFTDYYKNRWQVTPSGESSTYLFTVNNVKKIDGFIINATVTDDNSADSKTTAIALYDSDLRIVKYPLTVQVEDEKFDFICEFNLWGSSSINFEVMMKDRQISSFSTITYTDGLITLNSSIIATWDMNNEAFYCQLKLYKDGNDNFLLFKSKNPVKIKVEYKVRDINIAKDIKKDELICSAIGNPIPKYEWRMVAILVFLLCNLC